MIVIPDNQLANRNKFKNISTGDCFAFYGELYMKGFFGSTMKPKAVNLVTGEIRDLDNNDSVEPIIAEFHYKH